MAELGKWKCNICGETEGVLSGICPSCGPSQTTPIDEVAEKIAGVPEAEAELKAREELKVEEGIVEEAEKSLKPLDLCIALKTLWGVVSFKEGSLFITHCTFVNSV